MHLSPEGIPISGLGDVDVDGALQEQALDLDRVLLSVLVYAAQAHSDGGRVVALLYVSLQLLGVVAKGGGDDARARAHG